MTQHLLSEVILCVGILSAVSAAITQLVMLRDIGRELGKGERDSDHLRVVQILYRTHRNLFPQSSLRKINCISLILVNLAIVTVIILF